MDEQIDFGVETVEQPIPGVSYPVLVSVAVHVVLAIFLVTNYHPVASNDATVPIAKYIQLIKQNPKEFVEAPGARADKARVGALWSDKNRHASAPQSTGEQPTMTPGDTRARVYTPALESSSPGPRSRVEAQNGQQAQPTEARGPRPAALNQLPADITNPTSRPVQTANASMASAINWHEALKQVGRSGSGGGAQGFDLDKAGGGGEKGFVEQGPVSFETQWYDWGEYAQSMVAKIRINWYENMPALIRTGMKGVVTIRFAIQRDGSITDITVLNSSSVPPFDFAAQKAIELSSKLNPLPKDFPNATEHVTCMFFYNMEPPSK